MAMAVSSLHDVNQLLRMGMKIIPPPVTHAANSIMQTFQACSRFWLLVYAAWLLAMDVFFTIFPTTILFVSVLTMALHYTRLPTPPCQFVHAVLGLDPNVQVLDAGGGLSAISNTLQDFASSAMQRGLKELKRPPKSYMDAAKKHLNDKGVGVEHLRNPQDAFNLAMKSLKAEIAEGFKTPIPDQALEQGAVLQEDKVVAVARRGAGADNVENTLRSFEQCKKNGCHFVQFDVRMTKDQVPVVFHDEDLIRMAGLNKKVKEMRVEELRRVFLHDVRHKNMFRTERIPDLEMAVEKCIEVNLKFFINIVDTEYSQAMVNAICDAYKRFKAMYSMAVVMSFHWKVIYEIRKKDPKILGCLATPYETRFGIPAEAINALQNIRRNRWVGTQFIENLATTYDNFADWLLENFLWWYVGLSAIVIEKDLISKTVVREWTEKGIHVFIWPVNSPLEKQYCNQVLRVGYFTDTVANDVVINPELSFDTGRNVARSGGSQPNWQGHHGQKKYSTEQDSSTDEMLSIPPSPGESNNTFFENAFHTLSAVASRLNQRQSPSSVPFGQAVDFIGGQGPSTKTRRRK